MKIRIDNPKEFKVGDEVHFKPLIVYETKGHFAYFKTDISPGLMARNIDNVEYIMREPEWKVGARVGYQSECYTKGTIRAIFDDEIIVRWDHLSISTGYKKEELRLL